MQASAFNLYVENYPEQGETLVHNTFSGAFAVLDDATAAALKKSSTADPLTGDELGLLDDEDLLDPDVAVVVRDRDAEEAEYADWFERRRSRKTLDCIVHVNRACNFACTYCCQEGVLDGSVMSEQTAADTADWLVRRAREIDADAMYLVFCGGEPLLHPQRIEAVAKRVRASGVPMTFGVITNGYFLTSEMVDRLLPLGFVHAQVTLDGDASTHSITRVSKRGADTFGRIFEHVVAASRSIRISINGNYEDETVHGFAPLVRKLADAGLPTSSRITFSPALSALTSASDAGSGSCTWSGSDTSFHVALQDEVRRHGFDPGGPAHAVGPCAFFDRHSFAVDSDGAIHKCPGFVGRPAWSIGSVASGLTDRYGLMLSASAKNQCGDCSYRPVCSGGCLADEWTRSAQMSGVNCEGEYFDRVHRDSVVREYLLAASDRIEDAIAEFPQSQLPPQRVFEEPPGVGRGRRAEALRVI